MWDTLCRYAESHWGSWLHIATPPCKSVHVRGCCGRLELLLGDIISHFNPPTQLWVRIRCCNNYCGTCRPTHRERYGTGLPWATAWPAGITAHSSLRGTPCALTLRGRLSDKPTPLPVSYAIYMRCVFLQGGALFLRAAWAGRCSATPHLARTVSERASERAILYI